MAPSAPRAEHGIRWIPAFLAGSVTILLSIAAGSQSYYREAPALAARVAAGLLPPVERRLPGTPLLSQVEERVGTYGGTWEMAMVGQQDGLLIYRTLGNESLLRWDPGWKRVVPNVAQSVRANADATVFTFHLRPGMRWSDGHPFTADDILFWFEAVASEPALAGEVRRWRQAGALPDRVEARGPTEVSFVFDRPNGLFLSYLAVGQVERGPTDYPRHALARFHPRTNPDSIAAEVRAAGVADWVELFTLKSQSNRSRSDARALLRRPVGPDAAGAVEPVPSLEAWVAERIEPGGPEEPARLVAERNPYYWKVDPAGNQLPYIDRVSFALTGSQDEVLALALAGRIGMQARHVANLLYRDPASLNRLQGHGYRLLPLLNTETNALPIMVNLTHPDPALRAVLGNREVRVALSNAIDRRQVIAKAFRGEGEPFQIAPRPESRFFRPEIAHQHLAFDPEAADRALDALGYGERDPDGFRLMPGGRRLGFTVLARSGWPDQQAALAIVRDSWQRIGVDIAVEVVDRSTLLRRVRDNRFDAVVGHPEGGIDAILDAYAYMPLTPDSYFAPAWAKWLENPSDPQAQEPPAPAREQIRLYERIRSTADPAEQDRLMHEILTIFADQFYVLGVALPGRRYGVARTSMRNVPRLMFEAWQYPGPAPTNPAQYFFE